MDDLKRLRDEAIAVKRAINAKNARIATLEADNARLMGLVEGFVTNAGVSDDPDTLMIPVSVYEEASTTLARIKENPNG